MTTLWRLVTLAWCPTFTRKQSAARSWPRSVRKGTKQPNSGSYRSSVPRVSPAGAGSSHCQAVQISPSDVPASPCSSTAAFGTAAVSTATCPNPAPISGAEKSRATINGTKPSVTSYVVALGASCACGSTRSTIRPASYPGSKPHLALIHQGSQAANAGRGASCDPRPCSARQVAKLTRPRGERMAQPAARHHRPRSQSNRSHSASVTPTLERLFVISCAMRCAWSGFNCPSHSIILLHPRYL